MVLSPKPDTGTAFTDKDGTGPPRLRRVVGIRAPAQTLPRPQTQILPHFPGVGAMHNGGMRGHMMKIMFVIANVDGDGALSFEDVTTINAPMGQAYIDRYFGAAAATSPGGMILKTKVDTFSPGLKGPGT